MVRWAGMAAAALIAGCATPPSGSQIVAPGTQVAMAAGVVPQPSATPPAATLAEANLPMDVLLEVQGSTLRARFGEPHQERRDGGAQVWNYEAPGLCRLNLVMQSVRRAPLKVVHAQARMAGGGTEETCLRQLERGGTGVVPVEAPVATPAAAPVRRAAPVSPRRGR